MKIFMAMLLCLFTVLLIATPSYSADISKEELISMASEGEQLNEQYDYLMNTYIALQDRNVEIVEEITKISKEAEVCEKRQAPLCSKEGYLAMGQKFKELTPEFRGNNSRMNDLMRDMTENIKEQTKVLEKIKTGK